MGAMTHNQFVAMFGHPGVAGSSYGDTYQAVYDAMTNKPSADVAEAQNTMVEALVDAGVWSKLDVFYLFAQESNAASEALINWVNPGTFDATLVNSGDITFTSLEGFASGGTSGYINTNWNPFANGVNFAQDDASHGIYSRSNIEESFEDYGINGGDSKWLYMLLRYETLNRFYAGTNDAGGSDFLGTYTDSTGFWIGNRTGASANRYYRNKVEKRQADIASTGLPNYELYICCYNSVGSPSGSRVTKQFSCFFTGSQLTVQQITDLTDAVEAYMDSNSKGIIP
jgi:hypothetical protein